MWHRNGFFLSLAGLVAGISLKYNNCPPLLLAAILLFSVLIALNDRKFCFFTVFLIAGTLTAYLHVRTAANDITKLETATVREAEGKILSARPDTFATTYVVRVDSVRTYDGESLKTSGKILLKTTQRPYSAFIPGTYLKMKDLSIGRIPPPQNPYTFDYRGFMERRGVRMEGKAEKLLAKPCSPYALSSVLYKIRRRLKGKIESLFVFFPEEKALVETITLGREHIPDFLREAGTRSGTYHLLVISGLHIAFILLFLKILFIPFARINNSHPRVFPFFSLLFMWFYVGLTGFKIPVVRAVLMLSFFNAGEILERAIDGLNSIMCAAILMLILNPYNLFDASFQLSFTATAGIILFSRRFRLLDRNFIQGLALTGFAAQLAVFPLIVRHFGLFYPAGLANNILFLPFTGLILILSLLFFMLPFLFVPLRHLLTVFLRGITASSRVSPPVAFSPSVLFLLLFYTACFLVFYIPRKKNTTVFLSAAAVFFLLLNTALTHMRKPQPDRLYFLSSGSPSVIFAGENTLSSAVFLADHYKRPEIENVFSPLLRKEGIKTTEGLFYTTLSYDHTGTLGALQKTTAVHKVYEHPDSRDTFGFHYNNIYFYRSYPELFEFMPENGETAVNGLTVEILGTERGKISYVLSKGPLNILLAPYLGETLSEKIKGRRFTAACIWDIRTTAATRKNLDTVKYLYLILPRDYKKFAKMPHPRIKTFYLNDGAVKMAFSPAPFRISHFYE